MKKIFLTILSLFIAFAPAYSFATTSYGGWTMTDAVIQGAATTITAIKDGASGALKSTAKYTPSVVNVGKSLLKGGGQVALAYAVVELLDEGIDWVLDPENNAVKYTYAGHVECNVGSNNFVHVDSAIAMCSGKTDTSCFYHAESNSVRIAGSNYNYYVCQPVPASENYLPIEQVAQQVIADAEAGSTDAQEFLKGLALEGFAAGELDPALDANAKPADATDTPTDTPTDGTGTDTPTDTPTDPQAPPTTPELPAFCSWAAPVCDFIDWFSDEPPQEEEPVPVPYGGLSDVGLDSVDRYEQRISFDGQCPVNDLSFTMMGVTYAQPIPYQYLCDFLSRIAPWLLAMCYLGTAYFVVENV